MKTPQLLNYERDRWVAGDGNLVVLPSAIDGSPAAMTGSAGIDFGGLLRPARKVGGGGATRLVSTNYRGATPKLALAADGLRLHAIVPAGTTLPAEGEAVVLTFNREHLHLRDEPA